MATWAPITGAVVQRVLASGLPASGYVLKLYAAGTSDNIPMATDTSGATQANYATYNATGDITVSGNTIIPHVNQDYKLCIYANQAAADADTPAVLSIDYITLSSGVGLFSSNDAANDSVTNVVTITHSTTGVPANGIGTGLEFKTETSTPGTKTGTILESVATDVSVGSEDFDFVLKLMAAGAPAAEKLRVKSGGGLVPAGPVDVPTGSAIASAATINLDAATGNRVHITGTTAITAVTLTKGPRTVIFDGILTLTHHATNNNLPGATNITTAAGDRATYESDGTTVYCVDYVRAASPVASVTGVLKATAGVLAAAVSGTDIKTINGSSLLGSGDLAVGSIVYVARTSNTIITNANHGSLFEYTSGAPFTQTFDPCASMGANWFSWFKNSTTGVITLDPDSSELIGGVATAAMNPGDIWLVSCTGTALTLQRVQGMNKQIYTSGSGNFTVPAGVTRIYAECVGGGGGCALNTAGAAAGGAYSAGWINTAPGASIAYAVGAGGGPGASAGGNTTFGALTANGGAAAAGRSVGGTASGGDININGGYGCTPDGDIVCGASPIGAPIIGDGSASIEGPFPGGGAAGGSAGVARAGGSGVIIITWT